MTNLQIEKLMYNKCMYMYKIYKYVEMYNAYKCVKDSNIVKSLRIFLTLLRV